MKLFIPGGIRLLAGVRVSVSVIMFVAPAAAEGIRLKRSGKPVLQKR